MRLLKYSMIKKSIFHLLSIKYRYLLNKSIVRGYGDLTIGRNSKIYHSNLFVAQGAKLYIADNVIIRNAHIYVSKGSCYIDDWCIISAGDWGGEEKIR
jgi:hypothetical protein